jgi:hypothetical protein
VAELVGLAGKEPSISQTIDRQGPTHVAEEEIGINIDTLPSGRYQLAVSVSDRHSGQAVEVSTVFEKIGSEERASR